MKLKRLSKKLRKVRESQPKVTRNEALAQAKRNDPRFKHAIVEVDGYKLPLIGIPPEAGLETCDVCGEKVGLAHSVFTGTQMLCPKCAKP